MFNLIILLISFIGLFWAANHLVTGSAGIAHYYRISPLVIGLTIVAICSSAPQIMVAISSSIDGRYDLAMGNAIGSNIANIGLILGLTTVIRPLNIRSTLWRREYPLLFLVMLFIYSLTLDGYLGVLDGCLLIFAFLCLIGYLIYMARISAYDVYSSEFSKIFYSNHKVSSHLVSLLFALLILPFSAHYFVNSAVILAHKLGLNDLVIGLTIVAIGTSLPQVTTSLIAAMKGQDDIAIGNILGSNMVILLLVFALPSIIHPSTVSRMVLWRDIPVMIAVTLVLLLMNYKNKKKMSRWHGGLLLLIYASYVISLIFNAL